MNIFIHSLADVQSREIGANSRIWQSVVILPGARIGADCNISSHCFIDNDVVIGDRVTIKNGVKLSNGVFLGNDVFIGPNASFGSHSSSRNKHNLDKATETQIENGVSIGAGATILPGMKIGRNAMVEAGSVVTRSIPPNAIVMGNPARIAGYIDAVKTPRREGSVSAISRTADKKATSVPGVSQIQLPRVVDIRGSLTVGEFPDSVPFGVKRYFLVFGVPSIETRGEHAHKECHQFLICVHGSCAVIADNGVHREEFFLDQPDLGLHLPPMVWGIQYKFSPDTVLLVFASHHYDANDYIRDYDDYLAQSGLT